MTDNLNAMKGKCDALQRERDKLVGVKTEREELEVNFYELKREYSALEENFNAVREELDTLQRDKEKLVRVEGTLKMLLDEEAMPVNLSLSL